ncbi:histidinol-phosphatase (PHP family) [Paenibacillus shirakamiensis]|uniref:Histidinol-phosphatase n=1 Tax=Paenibacillus shirakamiensis TaxID=1265935 RepID=A0ABS4JDR9_9BACL|nr:histidinol-phosphatase HisJ family protein [Paenibacillus shirakamiensis]MBP1999872.1 histidinol-phosphatase (PHP family) [Paenibacillus shirakamiensis]
MKVDFHFHLEEGPYSMPWLEKTAQALMPHNIHSDAGTLETMTTLVHELEQRVEEGCFSERWISRYLEQGQKEGIQQFGVVDHLYRFKEFKSYYEKHILLDNTMLGQMQRQWLDRVCVYSIEDYIEGVQNAKKFYGQLSMGIEADYFEYGEEELREILSKYPFDYVIGSVHFLDGWGFDNPDSQQNFYNYNLNDLYAKHYSTVIKAAGSQMFQFIAHLDNLKVFKVRPPERELLHWYNEVAMALATNDLATEINTGLAYRYPVKEMCPSPNFLRVLHKHGVPITLSSDAHFPQDIGTQLDEAIMMAKCIGYEEIVYFKNKTRHTLPL